MLFAGLAALFYTGMYRDNPGELQSVFVGRPAPVLPETTLPGLTLLTADDLRSGEVTVVNFWASWCPPCRAEHPVLLEMAARGVRVAGINMMDDEAKALDYLAEEGNPFFAMATDPKVGIGWNGGSPRRLRPSSSAGTDGAFPFCRAAGRHRLRDPFQAGT